MVSPHLVEQLNRKILFVGPLKDYSGYASAARDYVKALDYVGAKLVTRSLRYDGGDYVPNERFQELEDGTLDDVEIVFQHTTPNEMEPKPGKFNVGAFCWETDRIPQLWVDHLNRMDLVLVPCQDNLEVARRCGVLTPIEKIHYACDVDRYVKVYNGEVKPFIVPQAAGDFKFLSVFQFSKKKAFEVLLKSYLTEFGSQDPVCLMVKTYMGPNDGPEQRERIMQIIQACRQFLRLKDYPKIHLIHGILGHEEMDRLYATADCYVLPSRGEGWGVPHFDAMGCGLPPIATNGTGPVEFITPDIGWLVDSHYSPVIDMPHPHDFLYTGKENWREPHVDSLKAAMREAYTLWSQKERSGEWDTRRVNGMARAQEFSYEHIGPQLFDTIMKYYEMWKRA